MEGTKITPAEDWVKDYYENGQAYEHLVFMVKEAQKQAIEATLEVVANGDFVMPVDTEYNSKTGNRDEIFGLDTDAILNLKHSDELRTADL